MAKTPQPNRPEPRSHGKVSSEDSQDILDQFIDPDDDEDQEQLGENIDDDGDDDDTTGAVDENDDSDDGDDDNSSSDDDFDPKKRIPEDKKGNLLGPDGKIIAAAGKERGIFEKVRARLKQRETELASSAQQLAQIATGARDLMAKYKALQEEKGYGQQLGLEANEIKDALETFAQAKIDPKAAIKKILTRAHLAGTDLSDIGVSGPLDPEVVARHVLRLQQEEQAKKTPPATAAVDDTADPQAKVNKEAKEFFDRHPDAINEPETVLDAIATAKNKYPHLTLDHIYLKMKEHIAKLGGKPQQRMNGKPQERTIPHNSNVERRSNKKGLDTQARAPNKSFNDIGRELLADLKALEE